MLKKNRKGSSSFFSCSAHFHRPRSSFRSRATHARHIGRQSLRGEAQQTLNNSKKAPFLLRFAIFLLFVSRVFASCRTEPGGAVAAAKYYSDNSSNLLLPWCSPFPKVLVFVGVVSVYCVSPIGAGQTVTAASGPIRL